MLFSIVAGLLAAVAPASARILKTRQPRNQARELALVFGSGFEYETDGEESEYGFPFLAEYGFTDIFKLSVEPSWVLVRKKTGESVSGPGDLELTITSEFPTERRYRPGFALEATVKLPTAKSGDLGTGEVDYTLGAVISKEFVRFDVDFNAAYTRIGDPPGTDLHDTFEMSLASEYHLNETFDLEGEVVAAFGAGRVHGSPGSLGGFANIGGPEQGQSEAEGTLGLAEHLGEYLKFEQGAILKSDGSWQFVLAWEYDFAGGR